MAILGNITGSNSAVFIIDKHSQSLRGKTIVITGGDGDIGKQVLSYLVLLSPAEIWLAVKDLDAAKNTIVELEQQAPDVRIQMVQLDLASLPSIRTAVATLVSQVEHIDLLFLHAGVMGLPAQLTSDGYEFQFGINHLGHALLTKLLLPTLLRTAQLKRDVRVIVTSSCSHHNCPARGIDFDTLKTDGSSLPPLKLYAQSKLANILFTRALAERYPQLKAVAIHPGACRTNLTLNSTGGNVFDWVVGYLLSRPVEVVAKHHVWAAVAGGIESGEYYEPLGMGGRCIPEGKDKDLTLKLWEWTEQELEPYTEVDL
jgi:NAD(P)-dependent dehydrogenase (short-subunit alcohol dehydrogenase family)